MDVRINKKDKQIIESRIEALILLAKQDGAHTNHQIATWVIDHNRYWCTLGYWEIMRRLDPDYILPTYQRPSEHTQPIKLK